MKSPEERAAEWEKKRRRNYMKVYREKNGKRISEQKRSYYRAKTSKEGKNSGEAQG